MSRNSSKSIRFSIVICEKDICRAVFQQSPENNRKYDIKFEFLGNPFRAIIYKLFNNTPETIDVSNDTHKSISYHSGSNNRQVVIHIKDDDNKEKKYTTLPLHQIVAPSAASRVPLPIFKMEIPPFVISNAKKYNKKRYHHVLNADDCNTFEFYIAPEDFKSEYYFGTLDSYILTPQFVLPFEYFATNTVISNSPKYKYFISESERLAMTGFGNINGMKLFVVSYYNPELNSDKTGVTFIENKFSNEILFNTLYRKPLYDNSCIYLGNSNIKNLEENLFLFENYKLTNNTGTVKILKSSNLSKKEKLNLAETAQRYRIRLLSALKELTD